MFLLDVLGQDLRYALRGLRNDKGLAFGIVITLMLGLGVNAAVFSLLDRVFVRPPEGVAAPESVRRMYVARADGSGSTTFEDRFSYPQWLDLQGAASSTAVTTYALDSVAFGTGARGRRIVAAYIDSAYWSLLGVRLAMGRGFTAEEARIDSPSNLAIISDAFWRTEFGATPNVIGQQRRLGALTYTVIGVAPSGFAGVDLDETKLWLPLGTMPMPGSGTAALRWYQIRGVPLLRVLARSQPDASGSVLDARLTSAFRAGSVADGYRRDTLAVVSTASIISALGPLKRQQEVALSTRLAWVSIFILIIASANVANLLLVRAMHRQREIAVRLALGVSRRRLALQLLIESSLLALSAAAAATIVGAWTGALLRKALLPQIHWNEGLIDGRIAALTGATALIAAVATGLAPLAQTWRLDLTKALKCGGRVDSRPGGRLRSALVMAQTALAVALITGAGLCTQSLRHVLGADLGYEVDRLVIAEPRLVDSRGGEDDVPRADRRTGLPEVARRLLTTDRAGIQDVALATHGPMGGYILTGVRIPGSASLPKLNGEGPAVAVVSPEYAKVVGLRMTRGRFLSREDREGAPLAAVVNETMARTVWPDHDAVGQCVKLYGETGACYTVVGVVRNARRMTVVETPKMQFYVPLAQATVKGGEAAPNVLVIRTVPGGTAMATASAVHVLRDVMPSVDPAVHPMETLLAKQFRPWRLGATLFSALGVLALIVALLGIYGVIAFSVKRRTHEMGVRMALGAQRATMVALVLREGIRTSAGGIVIGGALALLGGRLLSPLLYETSPHDPVILLGATAAMLGAAALASSVPSLRAARVDPAKALRTD